MLKKIIDFLAGARSAVHFNRYKKTVVTLVILFLLKIMECLKNGFQPQSEATPLLLMKAVTLASSQNCCSIDADICCKWAPSSAIQTYNLIFSVM